LTEKFIDEDTFKKWFEKKKIAELSIVNREEKVAEIDAKIETDLELIGSTAIEDKL